MNTPLIRTALLSACAVSAPAQITVQVQGGGAALANAIAVAPDDSVFVVAPGDYLPFSLQDKHATIVAPQRATILGRIRTSRGSVSSSFTPQLRLRGIDIAAGQSQRWPGFDPGLIVGSCHLVLHDCTCEGISLFGSASSERSSVAIYGSTIGTWIGLDLTDTDAVIADTWITVAALQTKAGGSLPNPAIDLHNSVLRAERITLTAANSAGGPSDAVTASQGSFATIADSDVTPGLAIPISGVSVRSDGTSIVRVSPSTAIRGGVAGPVAIQSLATARWTSTARFSLGNTVTARFEESPSIPVGVVLSRNVARFDTALASEPLFVFGTADWFPLLSGLSDSQGRFDVTLTLPNIPSLRYSEIYLTGLFGGTLPIRSTMPLGGITL